VGQKHTNVLSAIMKRTEETHAKWEDNIKIHLVPWTNCIQRVNWRHAVRGTVQLRPVRSITVSLSWHTVTVLVTRCVLSNGTELNGKQRRIRGGY